MSEMSRAMLRCYRFCSRCCCLRRAPAPKRPRNGSSSARRVHGGFGSFLPVGIRIGEDAMKRLNAKPRELSVVFYQGDGVPCPCPADGVMLAVGASPGQGTLQVAAEKSPPGTFAVVVIRPRKGGDGLKYTVPMSLLPKLGQINSTIQDPLARYNAVMALPDLFTVEPVK